jgi:transposase InsO family protein
MKYPSAYLKMRVLGAIDTAEGKTRNQRIKNVAALTFTDEDGNPRKFTWRTIQTWYYRYKNHGITGMTPRGRSDRGMPRKITPEELLEAVNQALPHFRHKSFTRMNIYRFCIKNGLLSRNQVSQTSFYRLIRQYDLLNPDAERTNRRRRAFSMQYANQLWQADTMFGPYVRDGSAHRQAKLIAFLDDASRVLCHGEFFFEENVDSLVRSLKAAFYKRGIPEQLYVDNGSIYSCQEITLICARIGCILRHTPVRDASAKGKVERFFRTVRDRFLSRQLDLSSLGALNRAFAAWAEDEYNAHEHSAIGLKPIDRFGMDLKRIRFLSPSDANDELFFAEETRSVKKDNTFSFRNVRFETPADLRNKKVSVRYERGSLDRVIVYYKGERVGRAHPLDAVANGLLRREERTQ